MDKDWSSVLLNPGRLPSWFTQRRLAIVFVDWPVGLLTSLTAVLESLEIRKKEKAEHRCSQVTYQHEETVLAAVLAEFFTVRVVRRPVGADKILG